MFRMTDAGDDDLGVILIVVVNIQDLLNQFHAVVRDVVQASDKGAHVGRACFGRHQGLQRGKDQGLIDVDAVRGEHFGRFESFGRHRHLDDHLIAQPGQFFALCVHSFRVEAHHLQADRPFHNFQNFLDDGIKASFFFGNQ